MFAGLHSRSPSRNSSPKPPQDEFELQTPVINPRPPPVESKQQRDLWQKINHLREIGVGNYIELPQLVVVGDQSSGKSSVLEALTELPFPRDSGLCTRFATQVSFCCTDSTDLDGGSVVTVSVRAADDADGKVPDEKRARIEQFRRRLVLKDGDELSAEMFTEWFAGASKVMGIPGPGEVFDREAHVGSFSSDVLCITIEGPDKQNLTVTDLPGLIKTATEHQNENDIEQIKKLTMDHITRPKSIILCVLAANVDVANQSVLQFAKDVDKYGERTLGVITKPDLVDRGGEGVVLSTAKNEVKKLKLGYFVVCNRGAQDLKQGTSIESRHLKEEAFFQRAPWNSLPPDRLGIKSLRNHLSELQYKTFCTALPQIVAEIDNQFAKCKQDLENMGEARDTEVAQKLYLFKFASHAKELTRQGLSGDIGLRFPEGVDSLRLHLHMGNLFDKMPDHMAKYGNKRPFMGANGKVEKQEGPGAEMKDGDLMHISDSNPQRTLEWISKKVGSSLPLDTVGRYNYNPQVFHNLFREMSENWVHVARFELNQAKEYVKNFNEAVIDQALPPNLHQQANRVLRRRLRAEHDKLFKDAEKEMMELLKDERESVALMTQNDNFTKLSRKLKQERVKQMVRRGFKLPEGSKGRSRSHSTATNHGLPTPAPEPRTPSRQGNNSAPAPPIFQFNDNPAPAPAPSKSSPYNGIFSQVHQRSASTGTSYFGQNLPPTQKNNLFAHLNDNASTSGSDAASDQGDIQTQEDLESMAENFEASMIDNEKADKVLEIHDDLKAYYRIARKRFVDNLVVQVIERRLLRPLAEIYGDEWQAKLGPEDYKKIAGEEASVALARSRLKTKLERLDVAKMHLDDAPISITVTAA